MDDLYGDEMVISRKNTTSAAAKWSYIGKI